MKRKLVRQSSIFFGIGTLAYMWFIGYGGLLKKSYKELNLGNAENGDLVNIYMVCLMLLQNGI